jgi:3-deoxy-D-manno-octulosonate 8-phosphate phosphatase (KDO 8-P phosphatase)
MDDCMDRTPDLDGLDDEVRGRFARVKLFLCDVDGVLTDATVFVGESRESEFKQFNIQDGLGIVLLRTAGIPVGWVSARFSPATRLRAEELRIDYLVQGSRGKLPAAMEAADKAGVGMDEVLFMGDDIVDLAVMRKCGLAVAVRNARRVVRDAAHYVTASSGGRGAVREVCDLLLHSRGLWDTATKKFFSDHE